MSDSSAVVESYLATLPAERRDTVARVREVVLENLPAGFQESMSWGMLSYEIPLDRYPKTYNKQPLVYISLASQKNHYALYLMCAYGDEAKISWLQERFREAGKKLDMGKSCLRFRKLEDLPLDVIGELIAAGSVDAYIEHYERSRAGSAG